MLFIQQPYTLFAPDSPLHLMPFQRTTDPRQQFLLRPDPPPPSDLPPAPFHNDHDERRMLLNVPHSSQPQDLPAAPSTATSTARIPAIKRARGPAIDTPVKRTRVDLKDLLNAEENSRH